MNEKLDTLLNRLERDGYGILENYVDETLAGQLRKRALLLYENEGFKKAGIGRQNDFHINKQIRGDFIHWLDRNDLSDEEHTLFSEIDQIKHAINRTFFLGLFSFEGHYAIYPKGGFYKRHIDVHLTSDSRVITLVLYLNKQWKPGDGGELKLYLENETVKHIEPKYGTLVCFLSNRFEHEVCFAKKRRTSFTGWFRKREDILPGI